MKFRRIGQGSVMPGGAPQALVDDDVVLDIDELTLSLRRFVGSLVRDPHDADDVVQETLTRVLPVRDRLDGSALTGYALTVARNLVHDLHRGTARGRRLLPRLVDRDSPEQPEAAVIALEERRALRSALDQLPSQQRDLMLAHDLHGEPLHAIDEGSSPAALAARLARARARARVDYVLALRGVQLPTPRCRPVLLSLSSGDQRRQRVLRSGSHVVSCDTCAVVAPALLRRDRALAGLLPWASAGGAFAWLATQARRRHVQIGTAATAAVAAGAVAVAVWPSTPPPTSPSPAPADLQVAGAPLLPVRDELSQFVGRTARASRVPVLTVPADEGFWVGRGNRRVWVQLRGPGESGQVVRAGALATFRGTVAPHGRAFPRRVGVGAREGAGELARQGHHLVVRRSSLRLSR